jgi:outer membrane protein OmpA-like peptidoglycan-associated protein
MAQSDDQQADQPSKVDIFAGYAFLRPGGKVNGASLRTITPGFNASTSYFMNRYAGVTLDGGAHFGDQATIGTLQFGPIVRLPLSRMTPFAHALIGLHREGITGLGDDNGLGLTVGGGLDLHVLPRLSWRMVEADFMYAHHNFRNPTTTPIPSILVNNNSARVGTGLVWHFGSVGPPPAPPTAACSVTPAEVFEGEAVTATAAPSGFNPKHTVEYAWTGGQGVKVSGNTGTANIDTKGMQPGQYTVTANVTDPRSKKAIATCSGNFTIKQPRPPVISCSANPATVKTGESSDINCNASSPDNRSLTYDHKASGGSVTGNGPSARLSAAGTNAGPITVTSTVTDDRNLSASTTTTVNVENPPPPPPPPAPPTCSKLNSIDFKKNSPRVDNKAKAILDDVALRLQRDADSKAVIIGEQDAKEKPKTLSAQRANNAKAYLVKEKGIDPNRVSLRSSSNPGMTDDIWLCPAGATFDQSGTEDVAEKAAPAARKKPPTKKK